MVNTLKRNMLFERWFDKKIVQFIFSRVFNAAQTEHYIKASDEEVEKILHKIS